MSGGGYTGQLIGDFGDCVGGRGGGGGCVVMFVCTAGTYLVQKQRTRGFSWLKRCKTPNPRNPQALGGVLPSMLRGRKENSNLIRVRVGLDFSGEIDSRGSSYWWLVILRYVQKR